MGRKRDGRRQKGRREERNNRARISVLKSMSFKYKTALMISDKTFSQQQVTQTRKDDDYMIVLYIRLKHAPSQEQDMYNEYEYL